MTRASRSRARRQTLDRVDSVLLMGPRAWAQDHIDVIRRRRRSWLQYSAPVNRDVVGELERLNAAGRIDVFIYVPLRYAGREGQSPPIPGSGSVEYAGVAVDSHLDSHGRRIRPPGPTTEWPKAYDWWNDRHAYEYWFELTELRPLRPARRIEEFLVFKRTAGTFSRCIASDFGATTRHQVVLARQVGSPSADDAHDLLSGPQRGL
jgi:hypothetical protein